MASDYTNKGTNLLSSFFVCFYFGFNMMMTMQIIKIGTESTRIVYDPPPCTCSSRKRKSHGKVVCRLLML